MISTIKIASRVRLLNLSVNRVSYCSSADKNKPEQTISNIDKTVDYRSTDKTGGFAKAFEKQTHMLESKDEELNQSFATLLRNSKLVDLGDPTGKIVIGKVFHVVDNDLYIDFGWKFHCVCTRPVNRGNEYVRGSKVRIQVKDLELSSRFLGSNTDLTLLEADCKLLGLVSSPLRSTTSDSQ